MLGRLALALAALAIAAPTLAAPAYALVKNTPIGLPEVEANNPTADPARTLHTKVTSRAVK